MSVARLAVGALVLAGLGAAAWTAWPDDDSKAPQAAPTSVKSPAAKSPGTNALETRFRQLDADKDGRLTTAEAEPAKTLLAGADADGDGAFTLDEVLAHADAILAAMRAKEAGAAPEAAEDAAAAAPALASPREGPGRLRPNEHLVGSWIPDVALTDLDGAPQSLHALTARRPAIIALTSTSCPVSKRYLPVLARLAAASEAKGVGMVLVAQDPSDPAEDVRKALGDLGVTAPCVRDPQQTLQRTLGAMSSADAFLLDGANTLVYRGAVDDQYGLGFSLAQPRQRLLEDAVDALLAGRTPDIAATSAPGCALDLSTGTPSEFAPTYSNSVARLVQMHCLECHRTGGAGPFPLETYEQVAAKSGMIRRMVDSRLMPPWFASEPPEGESSPWVNDRSLTAREREDLFAWMDAGKPQGEPAEAPLPRTFTSEWQIGTPDVVLQVAQPIDVPAEGVFPWQDVDIPTTFAEDRWVTAIEVLPSQPQVVHHVLVNIDVLGLLAGYAPSNGFLTYPEGFAKRLPAGATLHLEIHYTPNGTAVTDQIRIGMVFSDEPPVHEVFVAPIKNAGLRIPPNVEHYPVTATIPVKEDMHVMLFGHHMHVRGTAFRYDALLPDGTTRTLLDVPRYDFNWQMLYRYAEPVVLPKGSKIQVTGWYDNNAGNPAVTDPTREVRWGRDSTNDEMLLGYVEYYGAPQHHGHVEGAMRRDAEPGGAKGNAPR